MSRPYNISTSTYPEDFVERESEGKEEGRKGNEERGEGQEEGKQIKRGKERKKKDREGKKFPRFPCFCLVEVFCLLTTLNLSRFKVCSTGVFNSVCFCSIGETQVTPFPMFKSNNVRTEITLLHVSEQHFVLKYHSISVSEQHFVLK